MGGWKVQNTHEFCLYYAGIECTSVGHYQMSLTKLNRFAQCINGIWYFEANIIDTILKLLT